MTLPLVVHPNAIADAAAIRAHYEQQVPGLGDRFAAALETAYDTIEAMPTLYGVVRGSTRVAPLKRFPYAVYYRVQPTRVFAFAVYHLRRQPPRWRPGYGSN